MTEPFRDRREAGKALVAELLDYADRDDVVVLGLPRGGVPVAYEVALRLDAPLDVLLVRKLGVPHHQELAMGAIASGGIRVLDPEIIALAGVTQEQLRDVIARETAELQRRAATFGSGPLVSEMAGKTAILIDDGLATGATMAAGVAALRTVSPAAIVVAVPVAAPETCRMLRHQVDRMVCLRTPERFGGVGRWYDDFTQTSTEEVRRLLASAAARPGMARRADEVPTADARSSGDHRAGHHGDRSR